MDTIRRPVISRDPLPRSGPARPEQIERPAWRTRCLGVVRVWRRWQAGDTPPIARSAQIGAGGPADQPTRHICRFGTKRQPLGCRKIERGRIAPHLANNSAQAATAQSILHCPKHVCGAGQIHHDHRTIGPDTRQRRAPGLFARQTILHPKDRCIGARQARQGKAQGTGICGLTWKDLRQGMGHRSRALSLPGQTFLHTKRTHTRHRIHFNVHSLF